ncbi:MAG TPA: PorV/PorQ family protein [Gemmatimonadales bacterium]|nr:PorV/PorQ family protein [Gemmatimonadales bacterium]
MHHNARGLLIAACLLAGGAGARLSAQTAPKNNTQYGTSGGQFLLLGAGARGAALGGTFAAVATSDASALYYNPAGIAMMSRPGLLIGTYDYVSGTRYSWAGLAFPFSGGSSAIGLQVGTFGFKDQPIYTIDQPDGTGATYSVSETFIGLTFAKNFSDRFSAGITAKGINDQLASVKGQAFAVDFGTHYHAKLGGRPIQFSFTLANLGSNLGYSGSGLAVGVVRDTSTGGPTQDPQPAEVTTKAFPLPTTFSIALAYDAIHAKSNNLTLLGGFNQPRDNSAGFAFGMEWGFPALGGSKFNAAVRGSYSYAPANNIDVTLPTALNDEENLQGSAFGGGLGYNSDKFRIGLDYAYRYMGVLGGTNFFSVSLGW